MGNGNSQEEENLDLHPLSRQRLRERRGSSLWFSENIRTEDWGRRFERELSLLKSKRARKIPQSRFLEALKKRSCERTRLRLTSSKGLIDIPPIPSPPSHVEKKFQIRTIARRTRRDSMERIRSRYLSRLNITPHQYNQSPPEPSQKYNATSNAEDSKNAVSGRRRSESVSKAARRSRRRIESSEQQQKTTRRAASPSSSNTSIERNVRDAPKRGRRKKKNSGAARKIKLNYRRTYGLGFMWNREILKHIINFYSHQKLLNHKNKKSKLSHNKLLFSFKCASHFPHILSPKIETAQWPHKPRNFE